MRIIFSRYVRRWPNPFRWSKCKVCGLRFGVHGAPLRANALAAGGWHDDTLGLLRFSRAPGSMDLLDHDGSSIGPALNYPLLVLHCCLATEPIQFPSSHPLLSQAMTESDPVIMPELAHYPRPMMAG